MLSQEEKLKLMKSLCWDYTTPPEKLLDLTEGKIEEAGAFDRTGWFVRCLQSLPWHILVPLWGGIERVKLLLTPETIRRVWPPARRETFERIRKILSGEPVPNAGWGSEFHKKIQSTILSYRWYSSKPRISKS
ncbi:MAG: hypothetical protein O9346_15305 [Leptospiraceae bacterium]|jgi:hypothetical protein|nr:hypothetical protein [Leptospiraceae bacterium]MCZ8347783.1 hypothetical protein [Leptospiraceae bacterium]